jgi:hypothetical protein
MPATEFYLIRDHATDDEVRRSLQEILSSARGESGRGQAWRLTEFSDSGTYAVDVMNRDATNSRAFRARTDDAARSVEIDKTGSYGTKVTGGLQVLSGALRLAGGLIVDDTGLIVSGGGAAVTGNSAVTGTLHVTGAVTFDNGLSVGAGGVLVSAGGADVHGLLHARDALTVDGGDLTVSTGVLRVNTAGASIHGGTDLFDGLAHHSGNIGFFGHATVGQQAGGAATADTTYSAGERDMIQAMWDALRSYGLLS